MPLCAQDVFERLFTQGIDPELKTDFPPREEMCGPAGLQNGTFRGLFIKDISTSGASANQPLVSKLGAKAKEIVRQVFPHHAPKEGEAMGNFFCSVEAMKASGFTFPPTTMQLRVAELLRVSRHTQTSTHRDSDWAN